VADEDAEEQHRDRAPRPAEDGDVGAVGHDPRGLDGGARHRGRGPRTQTERLGNERDGEDEQQRDGVAPLIGGVLQCDDRGEERGRGDRRQAGVPAEPRSEDRGGGGHLSIVPRRTYRR
jgi:hypothetical protein